VECAVRGRSGGGSGRTPHTAGSRGTRQLRRQPSHVRRRHPPHATVAELEKGRENAERSNTENREKKEESSLLFVSSVSSLYLTRRRRVWPNIFLVSYRGKRNLSSSSKDGDVECPTHHTFSCDSRASWPGKFIGFAPRLPMNNSLVSAARGVRQEGGGCDPTWYVHVIRMSFLVALCRDVFLLFNMRKVGLRENENDKREEHRYCNVERPFFARRRRRKDLVCPFSFPFAGMSFSFSV